jgi:hypothetical protein
VRADRRDFASGGCRNAGILSRQFLPREAQLSFPGAAGETTTLRSESSWTVRPAAPAQAPAFRVRVATDSNGGGSCGSGGAVVGSGGSTGGSGGGAAKDGGANAAGAPATSEVLEDAPKPSAGCSWPAASSWGSGRCVMERADRAGTAQHLAVSREAASQSSQEGSPWRRKDFRHTEPEIEISVSGN